MDLGWWKLPSPGFLFQSGGDPQEQPEVHLLRVGSRCFALGGDGGDLPAAVQTILGNGDRQGLQQAIDDAFPGSHLSDSSGDGAFRLRFHQPSLLRPLDASELSDGTLRYVLLSVALFSPRLPPLLVLNEPESSLDPDLLAPLAWLIHWAGATEVQGQTTLERSVWRWPG